MSSNQPIVEFDYRPNRATALLMATLVCLGAAWIIYLAVTVDKPVWFAGQELSPGLVRGVFSVLACLAPIGMATMLFIVYAAFGPPRRIALTPVSLLVPRSNRWGWSRDEIEIPLNSIRSLGVQQSVGLTLVRVNHRDGEVVIPSNMFAQHRQFVAFRESLQDALAAATNHSDPRRPVVDRPDPNPYAP